jgi:hypothetical protein
MSRPIYIFEHIYRSVLLGMRNVLDRVVEKIKTHFLCSKIVFRKSRSVYNYVVKYDRAIQARDNNMARAHCMLDNWISAMKCIKASG